MIQRIQSVWLLLASACAVLSFKLPFYSGTNKEGIPSYKLMADADHFALMLLTIVVAVLSLVCIFLFKNRTTQMRLAVVTMLVEMILLFLYYRETTTFMPGSGTYALSSILQVCILVFLFLAVKGINKDSKIVKDSERLR
jgi:uncharacterized membrane protein